MELHSEKFTEQHLDTQLEQAIKDHRKFIVLNSGSKLTETKQLLLGRDFALENRSLDYLYSKTSPEELLRRYKEAEMDYQYSTQGINCHELEEIDLDLTGSVAFNLIAGSRSAYSQDLFSLSGRGNYSCSLKTKNYHLELIDVWESIFIQTVLPCVKKSFSEVSYGIFKKNLFSNLDRTIYINSIFHELGHKIGPWKSSKISSSCRHLNEMQFGILSELSSDIQLVLNLSDYPEMAMFIILERLFWHGKREFNSNSHLRSINTDIDSWIAVYLWNKLIKYKVLIIQKNGLLTYNRTNVQKAFEKMEKEISELYSLNYSLKSQLKSAVEKWMSSAVPMRSGKFVYPENYRAILENCREITESPEFYPTFEILQK